jgi:hypothetical protein
MFFQYLMDGNGTLCLIFFGTIDIQGLALQIDLFDRGVKLGRFLLNEPYDFVVVLIQNGHLSFPFINGSNMPTA